MSDKIIPIRQERLDALEGKLKALRDWLQNDTLRRAEKDAHPYEKGFDDGWDAAREEVEKLL